MKIFVDSSFANGPQQRSVYGYAIKVDEVLIHWRSGVTPMVCLSTTEADFVAIALALKDVEWIYFLLQEANMHVEVAVIFCDNQGAIKIF